MLKRSLRLDSSRQSFKVSNLVMQFNACIYIIAVFSSSSFGQTLPLRWHRSIEDVYLRLLARFRRFLRKILAFSNAVTVDTIARTTDKASLSVLLLLLSGVEKISRSASSKVTRNFANYRSRSKYCHARIRFGDCVA